MDKSACPRAIEDGRGPGSPFYRPPAERPDRPDDGTCDYCGSLDGAALMARLEAGDVTLVPTDKNYKVYVRSDGGEPFRQTYGDGSDHVCSNPACGAVHTDDPKGHCPACRNADGSGWSTTARTRWVCREVRETKFYFQHLTEEQRTRFIELLNDKKLRLDYPGHFYRLPFFVRVVEPGVVGP